MDRLSRKDRAERDRPRRSPSLGKRHGAHSESDDSARSDMTCLLVGWHSGAGQDELPDAVGVGRPTNMVPDAAHHLPLIDETRLLTLEQECRVDLCQRSCLGVDVEQDLRPRRLARAGGLAACPRPLDEDGASRLERGPQFHVDDPRSVLAHPLSLRLGAGPVKFSPWMFADDLHGHLRRTGRDICRSRPRAPAFTKQLLYR
jgi:hypothetical protein